MIERLENGARQPDYLSYLLRLWRMEGSADAWRGSVESPQTGYDLSWWTVDGGGAMLSTGEGYRLSGTIGQPDAGVLSGGGYTLGGGFWRGGALAPAKELLYLPLVIR